MLQPKTLPDIKDSVKMIIKDLKKLPHFLKVPKENKKEVKKNIYKEEKKKSLEETYDDDKRLFLAAVDGVTPLKNSTRGREVIPENHEIKTLDRSTKKKDNSYYLNKFLKGEIEFEIENTDEYIQGKVKGLNETIFRKLKTGFYSPEAHLDLHGYTVDDAHIALIEFIKKNYFEGKRCLLIIPGRGKNSPMGRGVLRDSLEHWITKDPLKRVVLAFSTAVPKHGGAGAVYILLRKYKKSRGKIFWDRF